MSWMWLWFAIFCSGPSVSCPGPWFEDRTQILSPFLRFLFFLALKRETHWHQTSFPFHKSEVSEGRWDHHKLPFRKGIEEREKGEREENQKKKEGRTERREKEKISVRTVSRDLIPGQLTPGSPFRLSLACVPPSLLSNWGKAREKFPHFLLLSPPSTAWQ